MAAAAAAPGGAQLLRAAAFNPEAVVKSLFRAAIQAAYPTIALPEVLVVPGKKSDFQCNNAMALAKAASTATVKLTAKQVADELIRSLPTNDVIATAAANDQGFINVELQPAWCATTIRELVQLGKVLPPPVARAERVLVDFSSPNIAKEMHVGHLRSTIIGECLCRLFEFAGHHVDRINHVGDWGTQFGMLILYLKQTFPNFHDTPPNISDLLVFYKAAKAKFDADPEFKEGARLEVVKLQSLDPECIKAWQLFCDISRAEFQQIYDRLECTLTERGESFYNPYIPTVLQELERSHMLEESEGAKLLVSRDVKKLSELSDKDMSKLISALIREKRDGTVEYSPVLLKLMRENKVLIVNDKGEEQVVMGPKDTKLWSKFDLMMDLEKLAKALSMLCKPALHPEMIAALGHLIQGDSIRVPRFNFPLIAVKSDGGFTYDTTDLAAIHHRFIKEKQDRVVYVTDVGQYEHFRMVASAAQDMGWLGQHGRWQHAGFGLVSGEDGKKLKTRSGDTIKLKDLLDEARDRSLEILREREANEQSRQGHTEEEMLRLSRIIGYGAVKYFDLKQNRTSDYKFSFDKVLDLNGNTAVFLLYSYARLCSIQRKAGVPIADALAAVPTLTFTAPAEKQLALYTLRLNATIEKTVEDLMPKNLTDYAYDLVVAVSDFYRDCRVLGDPNMNSRLVLIEAVRMSLKLAMHILGISVADRL